MHSNTIQSQWVINILIHGLVSRAAMKTKGGLWWISHHKLMSQLRLGLNIKRSAILACYFTHIVYHDSVNSRFPAKRFVVFYLLDA